MKIKSTVLKTGLVALFVLLANAAMSATVYVCTGAAFSLGVTNLPAGTTALWDVRQGGTSIAGYPSATAPTSFATAGSYEVILVSITDATSGACTSDPVSNTVNALPPLALTLGTPTNPAYCEGSGTAQDSEISAADAAVPAAYATDLGLTYTYSVNNGSTTVDGATVGTVNATTGAFTLTTKTPGTYVITGTVQYNQLATNTTNNLLGNGCPFTSTTTRTVTVTPKPGQPTVTIAAN